MKMLNLSYTIQLVILNVCTKFQILGRVGPKKSLMDKKKKKTHTKKNNIYIHTHIHRQTNIVMEKTICMLGV